MEVPSTDAGVVKEIKVKMGDKVSQGSLIVVLETAGAETSVEKEKPSVSPQKETQVEKTEERPVQTGTVIPAVDNENIHAGPLVRKLAREFGVNLSEVPPSITSTFFNFPTQKRSLVWLFTVKRKMSKCLLLWILEGKPGRTH